METFSALLAIYAGNSPVPGEFPTQRPVTRSFDVYFDLRPNKRLSKQSWGWWFETPSRPLWRHRNVFPGMRIPSIKIRRWWDSLIFIIGNPIRLRFNLYIETAPKWSIFQIFQDALLKNITLLTKIRRHTIQGYDNRHLISESSNTRHNWYTTFDIKISLPFHNNQGNCYEACHKISTIIYMHMYMNIYIYIHIQRE